MNAPRLGSGNSWARRRASWLLCVVLLGLHFAPHAGATDFASLLPSTERGLTHRALHARTRAWRALAETRDPRALARLLAAYDRTGEPTQGRALLASITCANFGAPEHLERLTAWRTSHDDVEHAWLWYRTLHCEVAAGQVTAARALAQAGNPAWQRAVALEALASGNDGATLALMADGPAALEAGPLERTLVLEALAHAWSVSPTPGTPEHREAGLWLVDQLDRPETPARARVTLLRALSRALRPAVGFSEANFWRGLLQAQATTWTDERPYATTAKARFLDLDGSGRRVVYVLDCSGSMAEPLSAAERGDLRRLAAPSAAASARAAALPARRGSPPKDVWDGVRRRLDAAVALLRLSLRSLPEGAHFTVVVFASKHAYLHATPGLVPATRAHVANTIQELDQLVVGSASPLGGGTNLHGGLSRALQSVEADGARRGDGLSGLVHGADTLFVLSDGSPGTDDWSDEDPSRRRSTTFDPHADQHTFFDPQQLLEDVARLNLLRRCEIHCVGIGVNDLAQASGAAAGDRGLSELLQRLVLGGHGRYRGIPSTPAAPTAASLERTSLERTSLESTSLESAALAPR